MENKKALRQGTKSRGTTLIHSIRAAARGNCWLSHRSDFVVQPLHLLLLSTPEFEALPSRFGFELKNPFSRAQHRFAPPIGSLQM
jgi:hypothetical protein